MKILNGMSRIFCNVNGQELPIYLYYQDETVLVSIPSWFFSCLLDYNRLEDISSFLMQEVSNVNEVRMKSISEMQVVSSRILRAIQEHLS